MFDRDKIEPRFVSYSQTQKSLQTKTSFFFSYKKGYTKLKKQYK